MNSPIDKESLVTHEQRLEYGRVDDPETKRLISIAQAAFVKAAQIFEQNVAADERKKAKWSNRISVFLGFALTLALVALAGLTPLKSIEYVTMRVDPNSGYIAVEKAGGDGKTAEQIDDEFWLTAYVMYRESYNAANSDAAFNWVKLTSYTDTFAEYRNFQLSSKGYTAVLGDKQQFRTAVNNILFLKREDGKGGTAQVRFTKTLMDSKGVPDPVIKPVVWTTTMSWDYNNAPVNREQRWLNPRGFGVGSYVPALEVGGRNGH